VPGDLYAVLGVARDANDEELRRAYERELNRAAREGAVRHAHDVDRAWSVLRDPATRHAYDRDGVVRHVRRLPVDQRYIAPAASRFRAWSPPEPERPSDATGPRTCLPAAGGDDRRWTWIGVAIALAVAAGLGLLQSAVLRGQAAGEPIRTIQVDCPATSTGGASSLIVTEGEAFTCPNGASPSWQPRSG
jgi:hypothetical protein